MNEYSTQKKFLKICTYTKYRTIHYIKQHKKDILKFFVLIVLLLFFLKVMFRTKRRDIMVKEEIYDFINIAVDNCLQKKTRYLQNKEFARIETDLPIKPLKMTLTTAVFFLYKTETSQVLKRIIVNKKNPIYEDKIALKLNHPHIVKSYKSEIRTYKNINNETDTIIWLYMEYLPIKITQAYVKKNEAIIKNIAYDMLLGLQYLHNNNIAHLDLKIANVMGYKVGNTIRYKIIDFGYSRYVDKEVYLPGKNYGTFPYKPPEIVFNNIHGLKSDIWCLGAILLFLRMERTPFYDSNNKKNKTAYEKFISGKNSIKYPYDISPVLKDFIKGCMRLNREYRPTVEVLLNHKLFNENGLIFFPDEESTDYYDSSSYESIEESIDLDL